MVQGWLVIAALAIGLVIGVGVTAKDPPQVAILSNDKGKLTDVTKQLAGGSFAATGVAVGDVDKDGDLDLFFGVDTQSSRLYVNDGKATFQHASPDALPTDALNAGVVDMLGGSGSPQAVIDGVKSAVDKG